MRLPTLHRLALPTGADAAEEEEAPAPPPPYRLVFGDIPAELHPLIYQLLSDNDDPCQLDTIRACNNAPDREMYSWCVPHFRRLCHTGVFDPNNVVGYQPPQQAGAPYRCNMVQDPNTGQWVRNGNVEYSPYLAPGMQWMRQFALFCRIEHGRPPTVFQGVAPNHRLNALAVLRRFGDALLDEIPAYTFRHMTHVDLDTLPVTIQRIGANAFEHCHRITSMQLPPNLQRIGMNAFSNCINLRSITFPANNTVDWLSVRVFFNCRSLERITFPGHGNIHRLRANMCEGCVNLTHVVMPWCYRVIEMQAFDNCVSLQSVTVSRFLDWIDWAAFLNCHALERIGIGPDGTGGLPATLQTLSVSCFGYCASLTTMTLPPLITVIPAWCFAGCTSMHTINLNDGLLAIRPSAFEDCTALTRVVLPMSCHTLTRPVFHRCSPELVLVRGTDEWLASGPWQGRFGEP